MSTWVGRNTLPLLARQQLARARAHRLRRDPGRRADRARAHRRGRLFHRRHSRDRRGRAMTTAPMSRPRVATPSAALGRRAGRAGLGARSVRRGWCCSTCRACSSIAHRCRLLRRDLRHRAATRGRARSCIAPTTAASTYGARGAHRSSRRRSARSSTITGPPTDPTLPGDSPAYDTSNSITVTLFEGTLASITDAQIDAGQNMAAIGQRWPLGHHPVQDSDARHGRSRGRSPTSSGASTTPQHLLGTTVDGDTFVLLSDSGAAAHPRDADEHRRQQSNSRSSRAASRSTPSTRSTSRPGACRTCGSARRPFFLHRITEPPDVAGRRRCVPAAQRHLALGRVGRCTAGEIATWSDETDSWVYCTPAPGTIIHVAMRRTVGRWRRRHQRRRWQLHALAVGADECDLHHGDR